MDAVVVVAVLAALAATAIALEQVAVVRQTRACTFAVESERARAEDHKALVAQLLKQIRDLENRLMAKDIQGYQILAATDTEPSPYSRLGRSDEDEALIQSARLSAQER